MFDQGMPFVTMKFWSSRRVKLQRTCFFIPNDFEFMVLLVGVMLKYPALDAVTFVGR
jgi:hypothetical protein